MALTPVASIDLAALGHNLQQVKILAPNAHVMAAIKADGYGHGLCTVADTLKQADGFAVAHLSEAKRLREHGIGKRLLILSGLLDAEGIAYCAREQIDLVVHTLQGAIQIAEAQLVSPLNIWLKIDSGMHRLGLNVADLHEAHVRLKDSENVGEVFYMTHFSGSDEISEARTSAQIDAFQNAIATLPAQPLSLANSAAIIKGNQGHSDWVRPGIMLYGANPLHPDLYPSFPCELKPVMTLTAPVIAIREVPAGDAVGYNSRWTAARDSLVATVGIGYGDGYPRHAPNNTPVLINNQRAPLVGTVSMDMITVDITDCAPVKIGDQATLWGKGLPIEEIARAAGTISYELLTSVNHRVTKIYSGPD